MQGFFSTGLSCLVHTWGLHIKGPVYISLFKPLSIAIAASFSAIFLGDALHFGTCVFHSLSFLLNFNYSRKLKAMKQHKYLSILLCALLTYAIHFQMLAV